MAGLKAGVEPLGDLAQAEPAVTQPAESSDSDDQFTDAQSNPMSPNGLLSPVPKTRVEKVDDEPAHGEVPGTEAHEQRQTDAQPDEVTVIPETSPRSPSPIQSPQDIPVTVVEEAPGDISSHSELFENKRQADAVPDVVIDAEGEVKQQSKGDSISDEEESRSAAAEDVQTRPRRVSSRSVRPTMSAEEGEGEEEEDAFGDDFDDFEEGGIEDDFDDFEEGFAHPEPPEPSSPVPQSIPHITLPFSIPDFDGLNSDDIMSSTEPYLASLFPPETLQVPSLPPLSKDPSVFTTPRSASLWSQLVAPPPLAPPDWIRSRTRRLFLVSLGVPVDLDEILPASKQKKLVLPSLNIPANSPRTSTDSRSLSRLRQGEGNASSTSVDTQGRPRESKRRKGPAPPPDFDMVSVRHLCTTTDEALSGMTDEEIKEHIAKLEAIQTTAKDVLEYWQKRTDEKIGERETFEGVIENLVKHARKVRK